MTIPSSFPQAGDVAGKRVVLTGAGRGLGEGLAQAFSQAGARVALVARTEADIKRVASELPGESLLFSGDVRDADFNDAVADGVVDAWGGLDVWISNAGISPIVGGPGRVDPDVWRQIIDVNVTGAYYGARSAARVMADGGRIIFTGSVLGERPARGLSAYSASKAAINGMAKSLAQDLGPAITVNVVAPGWFESPLTEGWIGNEKFERTILGHTVFNRWGEPSDLSGAYLFLASDAAKFVTGVTIAVDGGYLLP